MPEDRPGSVEDGVSVDRYSSGASLIEHAPRRLIDRLILLPGDSFIEMSKPWDKPSETYARFPLDHASHTHTEYVKTPRADSPVYLGKRSL